MAQGVKRLPNELVSRHTWAYEIYTVPHMSCCSAEGIPGLATVVTAEGDWDAIDAGSAAPALLRG